MSTEAATNPSPRSEKSVSVQHPLSALSASELRNAAAIIKASWLAHTDLHFKVVTLQEPPKAEVLKYLEAEHSGKPVPSISRKAFVNYYIRNTSKFHEAVVDLTSGRVDSNILLGPFVHANGDGDEIVEIEKLVLADEKVQAEIAKLELPKGTVVISDPWIYGSDGVGDEDRLYQCFLYLRDPMNSSEADSNHYAMPLPISPVVSTESMRVIRVDLLPTGADNTIKPVEKYKIQPPNEYIPEAQTLRTDLKPLNVVQPEGASFQVEQQGTSSVISWQKWNFRVGFNQREGMVLYDVRYDNRSLFYRLSLSDMNIPYADPRHPFHKKSAFDLGDVGAGIMANNLKLGCDCLGSIYYLSAVLETVVEKSGGYDIAYENNRTFKIQNPNVRNPVNGKPVAYKIQAPPFQKILSDKDSFNYKRAEFSDHNIYVVKHKDGELYAGGLYTNQSRGGSGVRSWAERNENVKDTDFVVYIQAGINHVPRIEDFPVMPCEIIKIHMKPVNFFDKNPALDVPPSEQAFNKSSLLSEQHQQPSVTATIGEDGQCCAPTTAKL
ncbi:hypothetical protein AA0116_g10573 [Alternaria tenuissima]|nr:hypothetical protein AA0116_g10573 [Alternaria tenuissima]